MFKVKQFKLHNNDKNNNPVYIFKKNRLMLKIYNVKRNSAGLSSLCFVIHNCTRYILATQKRSYDEIRNEYYW